VGELNGRRAGASPPRTGVGGGVARSGLGEAPTHLGRWRHSALQPRVFKTIHLFSNTYYMTTRQCTKPVRGLNATCSTHTVVELSAVFHVTPRVLHALEGSST
jgi:hypothetical protein